MAEVSDLWRRLEAEGRLRKRALATVGLLTHPGDSLPSPEVDWQPSYYSLRLTDEEREKLKYLPTPRALVPQLTNSQLWGEE